MTQRFSTRQRLAAALIVSGAATGALAAPALADSNDSWWCKIVTCGGGTSVPGGVESRPEPEGSGSSRGLSVPEAAAPGEGQGAPPPAPADDAKPAEAPKADSKTPD